MANITHCNSNRRAIRYWLRTQRPDSDYEILLQAYCPNCKRDVYEHAYFTLAKGLGILRRPKNKELDDLLLRLKTDLVKTDKSFQKERRPQVFVSEHTLKSGKDPARDDIRKFLFDPNKLCLDVIDPHSEKSAQQSLTTTTPSAFKLVISNTKKCALFVACTALAVVTLVI